MTERNAIEIAAQQTLHISFVRKNIRFIAHKSWIKSFSSNKFRNKCKLHLKNLYIKLTQCCAAISAIFLGICRGWGEDTKNHPGRKTETHTTAPHRETYRIHRDKRKMTMFFFSNGRELVLEFGMRARDVRVSKPGIPPLHPPTKKRKGMMNKNEKESNSRNA